MIPALTGILAPHGLATSFESIATVTVGSGGSSTVSFSSIPSTYQHLQIRSLAKSTGSSWGTIRFNSDTGTNYAFHIIYGDGAAAYASASTGLTLIYAVRADTTQFGAGIVDILDYTSTNKNKTVRTLTGIDNNGSGYIVLNSGLWLNTNAITSITIDTQAGTFVQYSSFALYGVKA